MISIKSNINKYFCAECGESLFHVEFADKIHINPCESCRLKKQAELRQSLQRERLAGEKNGWVDGYNQAIKDLKKG